MSVAALPFASRVGEVLTAEPVPPSTGVALEVQELIAAQFELPEGDALVAIARPTAGPADESFVARLSSVADELERVPGISYVNDPTDPLGFDLVNEDEDYAAVLVGLEPQPRHEARETVRQVKAVLAAEPGLVFELAGGVATLMEVEEVSQRDARRAELYGLPIALVILVLAFGAVVAAGLPLLSAVTTIVVSSALLFALGHLIEFAVFTQTVVTMLGLATGIDYALLIVSRFREELSAGLGAREAAERTTREAGKAVAFSGITVVVALLSLLVPPVGFIRSIGVATTVVLVVAVLVAVTAVPATLALLGHNVNRLRVTRREPGTRSRRFWRARATEILEHPGRWAVVGLVVLTLLSLPA